MFACTVPPAEDVLRDWAHPDCSVVRKRAPYLPLGATRSWVHISSRAVTHSRGERVLSWGQHLCSPAKKARLALRGQAAVQHSTLCAASIQPRAEELRDEQKGCVWKLTELEKKKKRNTNTLLFDSLFFFYSTWTSWSVWGKGEEFSLLRQIALINCCSRAALLKRDSLQDAMKLRNRDDNAHFDLSKQSSTALIQVMQGSPQISTTPVQIIKRVHKFLLKPVFMIFLAT